MAKAGIVYVGSSNGLATYSDPGGTGRWRLVGRTLAGRAVRVVMAADALTLMVLLDGDEVLLSADGGQSFTPAPAHEAQGLLTLAGATGPLIATAHGLAQWKGEHSPAPDGAALALLAGKQEVLIAATADGAALMRSESGGASWDNVQLTGDLRGGVTTIVPASYHMDYVWAGTDAGQLLRSEDRGRSWIEVASEPAGILSLAIVRLA